MKDLQATIAAQERHRADLWQQSPQQRSQRARSGENEMFPLSTAQREYIAQRVVAVKVKDGCEGSGCVIKHDGKLAVLTCWHLLEADFHENIEDSPLPPAEESVRRCSVAFFTRDGRCELEVAARRHRTEHDINADIVLLHIDASNERFFKHYFEDVTLPMHTQLVYHATRFAPTGDDDDDAKGLFQLSSGFANYQTKSQVISSAFSTIGWGGGPVFHFHNNTDVATLVGIVSGGVDAGVVVELLPHSAWTRTSHSMVERFGLAVVPPCLEATVAHCREMNVWESTTTSASTTNSSLPPFDGDGEDTPNPAGRGRE